MSTSKKRRATRRLGRSLTTLVMLATFIASAQMVNTAAFAAGNPTVKISAANPDRDGDGVPNDSDNCPNVANADQTDTDQDGKGNVCDSSPGTENPGGDNPGNGGNDCAEGTHPDPQNGGCVPNGNPDEGGNDCPEGTHPDPQNGGCVPNGNGGECPAGTHVDAETGDCVPDDDGGATECLSGTHPDAETGECVPDVDNGGVSECPPGTHVDPRAEECVPNGDDGEPPPPPDDTPPPPPPGGDANPDILLTISSDRSSTAQGETVRLTYTVTNSGDTDLTNVAVDGRHAGGLGGTISARTLMVPVASLAPGETVTFFSEVEILRATGPFREQAVASAVDSTGDVVNDTATLSLTLVAGQTVTPTPPSPTRTKAAPAGLAFTGAAVVVPLAATALVLFVSGTLLLLASRRRTTFADQESTLAE